MSRANRVFLGFMMVLAGAALIDLHVNVSGGALMGLGIVLIISYAASQP